MSKPIPGLRSPYEHVGGLVYIGRMLDKIRLHATGRLPADYHENLGGGFDGRACNFLGIAYAALKDRVATGGSDEQILAWCLEHGRKPTEDDYEIWNDFMQKRGWRDGASERLAQRLQAVGLGDGSGIATFFDLIEVDEGRPPGNAAR